MKNSNHYSKQLLLLALMFVLIFQSCTKDEEQDNPIIPVTHERGEIVNQLPAMLSELLNPAFISDYNNGDEVAIMAAIQENTILDWTPQTPIHFFHGDADQVVPYQNVLTTIEMFNNNGSQDIQLTSIPGGTHETSGAPAIFGAIEWFENLKGT